MSLRRPRLMKAHHRMAGAGSVMDMVPDPDAERDEALKALRDLLAARPKARDRARKVLSHYQP